MTSENDKRLEIERRIQAYFDPSQSKISFGDKGIVKKELGFDLPLSNLIGLVGAPCDSEILVELVDTDTIPPGFDDPENKDEILPAGLRATITNKKYIADKNVVFIYFNSESGTVRIYIGTVDFLSRNFGVSGVAALMTRSILNWAQNMPPGTRKIDQLQLMAAGGRNWGDRYTTKERWIGYNVWPKCGFNMELHPTTTEILPHFPKFPAKIGSCKTVRDVLKLVGGKEFWTAAGDGWLMDFGVFDQASLDLLDKYLLEQVK